MIRSISKYSSLNFQHDWRLSFEYPAGYVQRFALHDIIRVQFTTDQGTDIAVEAQNLQTGQELMFTQNTYEISSGLSVVDILLANDQTGCFYLSLSDGENQFGSYFRICEEIENTVRIRYTHRRNEFDVIFYKERYFFFDLRIEGGFKPGDFGFLSETNNFRDQAYTLHHLSALPYGTKTLTIGGGEGVPYWVAEKVNLIFSLSQTTVNGMKYTRPEGMEIETDPVADLYPLRVYKLLLEPEDHYNQIAQKEEELTHTVQVIPVDPQSAEVIMNGQQTRSLSIRYGNLLSYNVSQYGYIPQSDTLQIIEDKTIYITLKKQKFTLTMKVNPTDAKVTATNQQGEEIPVMQNAAGQKYITVDFDTLVLWEVKEVGYVTKTGSWTATKDEELSITLERQSYTLTITVPDQTKYTSGVLKINGSAVTVSGNKYTGTFKYEDSVKIEYAANGIEAYTNTVTIPASNQSVDIATNAKYINYTATVTKSPSTSAFTYTLNGGSSVTLSGTSITGLKYNDKIIWGATATGYTAKSNQSVTITGNTTINATLTPQNYSLTVKVPDQTKYTGGVLKINGSTVTVASNTYTASIAFGTSIKVEYTANGLTPYTSTADMPVGGLTVDLTTKELYLSYTATVTKSDLAISRPVIKYKVNSGTELTLPDATTTITGLRYNDVIVWSATQTGHTAKSNQSVTITGNTTIDMRLTPIKYNITVNVYSVSTSGSLITSTGTNIFILDRSGGTLGSVSNKNTLTASIDYGVIYKIQASATGHETYTTPSTTILTVTGAKTENVALTKSKYTLTINPTPSSATVTFS